MNVHPKKTLRALFTHSAAMIAAGLVLAGAPPASALDNGLARTPPMGWNSWNRFGCNVNESLVRGMADAMVSSGMAAAGYQYVVIDDCWQVSRDSAGNVVADPARFPSGMKALADYVHARGLKFGLYTDAGTATCSGKPGTLNHEVQDAQTYASWGVDFVKEDWCNTGGLDSATQFARFRDALAGAGRPVLLSICNWGIDSPWEWGPRTGNMWRTTGDIHDGWTSITSIIDQNGSHASAARPGAWNDPDMLEVGNGGMTATEYRTHMSMWAIMAAPLIAGNDLGDMTAETRDILTAPEVIAVDQDPLGVQGTKVSDSGGLQVWAKRLQQDGAVAVALLNRTGSTASITAGWSAIGLPAGSATVRDLWARAERGTFDDSYTASVPSHGTVLVKIVAGAGGETLLVDRTGTGTGTVTSTPAGVHCGTSCSASYPSGTAVTLAAAPAAGSTFTGWSGACTGTGSCTVTMTAAQTVAATFTGPADDLALTVTRSGSGSGTVAGSGIHCGSTCSLLYAAETVVTLTATPASGSTFGGWTGACTGTGTCTVAMSAAQAVTATFTATSGDDTCRTPAWTGQSGNFNTLGEVCYTVDSTIHGWGCSNDAGRAVTINDTAVRCGQMPVPGSAPYTFHFTAGTYPWASFYWW